MRVRVCMCVFCEVPESTHARFIFIYACVCKLAIGLLSTALSQGLHVVCVCVFEYIVFRAHY